MGLKARMVLMGVGFLAACETIPQGGNSVGADGFFATNIGRRAGQAEALAAACPSIALNEATISQYKAAICERLEAGEGCSLPSFEVERQRLYRLTTASLAPLSSEQACAYTRAEAREDKTLSSFLLGAEIAPVVMRPADVVAEVPEGDFSATI